MTEGEWLAATDPSAMMRCDLVLSSPRKVRLCGCAVIRSFGEQVTDQRQWKALDAAERYADGQLTRSAVRRRGKKEGKKGSLRQAKPGIGGGDVTTTPRKLIIGT